MTERSDSILPHSTFRLPHSSNVVSHEVTSYATGYPKATIIKSLPRVFTIPLEAFFIVEMKPLALVLRRHFKCES